MKGYRAGDHQEDKKKSGDGQGRLDSHPPLVSCAKESHIISLLSQGGKEEVQALEQGERKRGGKILQIGIWPTQALQVH